MSVGASPKFELPPERLRLLAKLNRTSQRAFLAAFQSQALLMSSLIEFDLDRDREQQAGNLAGRLIVGRCYNMNPPKRVEAPSRPDPNYRAGRAVQYEVVSAVKADLESRGYEAGIITDPPLDPSDPNPAMVETWALRVKDRIPLAPQAARAKS
jgi:hypothetical protein